MARRKRKVSHDPPQLREWGGTPETAAKVTKGTIERLINNGRVYGPLLDAARQIEWLFNYRTRGLGYSTMKLDRVDGSRGGATETENASRLYKENFEPWANELNMRQNKGGPPILPVVLDIVTQDTQASDIDHMRRWRKGKAANYLVEGLELYAIQAGWIRKR